MLDRWILSRLAELAETVTKNLERYEIDRAAKPIVVFIDDLSTWYLRRSRDRFKGDNEQDRQSALRTTRFVLRELAKLMAPFTPFIAEDLYQKVKPLDSARGKESVHLESWPEMKNPDAKAIETMAGVRQAVSLGLEARAKAGIKIRQPLASVMVGTEIPPGYDELVTDELNVKKIIVKPDLGGRVELDLAITPELKAEGQAREFIRAVQDLRKKMDLNPTDVVSLSVSADAAGKNLIESFKTVISKTAQLKAIHFIETDGEKITVDDLSFAVKVEK